MTAACRRKQGACHCPDCCGVDVAAGCHDCPHPDYCAGMGECEGVNFIVTPSRRDRLRNWLDRHGWSSWAHVWFDFTNYEPLRQQGLSHKEAIAVLKRDWKFHKEAT